jgi:hypothetical protein
MQGGSAIESRFSKLESTGNVGARPRVLVMRRSLMHSKFLRVATVALSALLACALSWAQPALSPEVMQQIAAVSAVKASFTPAQKKMSSNLVFGLLNNAGDPRVASFAAAIPPMAGAGKIPAAPGSVVVEIRGDVNDALLGAIGAAKGTVIHQSARWGSITASLPTTALEGIAARSDVRTVRSPSKRRTNVGAVTSQGYIAHEANKTVGQLGYSGTGVKVGVLSDTASPGMISALIGTGDLPVGTTTLPGEDGGAGSDEGTAMMEIVHDTAPGASLLFATAFTSPASFADNIIALAAAGCKVIVDDVSWSDEGVFQDSVIAQAVNTVTASGVVYFSSAANSGNLTHGTSTTYEGDFLDGGAGTGVLAGAGQVHNFGTGASPVLYNAMLASSDAFVLQWSDPLGGSNNDYDLYVLNAAGTSIIAASTNTQDGTQDPDEEIFLGSAAPAGSRIVVVLFSGGARALHVDTFGEAPLTFATTGATYGHNAGANTMSMAAVYWNSAKNGTKPFTGAANPTEIFSSDGPRKIFYDPNGAAITPGNFLFGTNGGTTLQKPDLAAADGGSALTPGFNPFFGTSASAPHAAAIAALIRQARPDYTVAQVKAAMTATALDTMGAGVDRDAGYGIAMGYAAVQYALTH